MKTNRYMPVGVIGTALSMTTIANVYSMAGFAIVKPIFVMVGLYFWFTAARKVIFNFDKVKEEYFESTVTATLYATFAMLTMSLANALFEYFPITARLFWVFGVTCQIVLIFMLVIFHIFKSRSIDVVLPSWYVTLLGLLVASTSDAHMGFATIKQGIVIYGFLCYFMTIGIVVFRLWSSPLPHEMRRTKNILLAPISLIIVGYITMFDENIYIVLGLYCIMGITMFYILSNIRAFFDEGFDLSYASLTFPSAIAVVASYKTSEAIFDYNIILGDIVLWLGQFQLIVSSAIIMISAYNYWIRRSEWNLIVLEEKEKELINVKESAA